MDGDFVLHGHGQERRRRDLEIRQGCGDGADDVFIRALGRHLKWNLRVMSRLSRELDFEIGLDGADGAIQVRRCMATVGDAKHSSQTADS